MYTSAFENNDYQVFNTRPVELPLNDMFKAVLAKNEYWNQGAAKIKNTYDSALGMDLTLDANKQVKSDYLLKTQDKIKQLSSMDLGDYDVQKQGLDLFTPLLQDKAIQYDNAITKHLHSIYQDAETYKDKSINGKRGEEGDGYSDKNLAYALKDFKGFDSKLSRDPKALENIWNQNKNASYVPYHNVYKEFQDIMKTCKGASTERQDPNGMYLQDRQNSGADPAQVRECLQSNLSDRANQQIKIDSWARFNQDPHLLGEYTIKNYEAKVKDYDTAITSYKAKEDALSGIIKKTPEQEQQFAQYKQYRDFYTTQKTNLADIVDKYNKGDIDYFKKNYEQLAFQLGKEDYLNNASHALRTDKSVDKFTANPVAISLNNWSERFKLEHQKAQDALKLEMLKGDGKGNSDYTTYVDPVTGEVTTGLKKPNIQAPNIVVDPSITGYQDVQNDNSALTNSLYTSLQKLQGDIQRTTGGDLGPVSNSLLTTAKGGSFPIMQNKLVDYNGDGVIDQKDITDWKDQYIKTINEHTDPKNLNLKPAQQKALKLINDWADENNNTIRTLISNKASSINIENSIPEKLKNPSAAAKAIKDIAYAGNVLVNSVDIIDALEGKSDKVKLNYSTIYPTNGNPVKVLTTFNVGNNVIDIHSPYYQNLLNLYQKVGTTENKRVESLNKTRNELYGAMRSNTNQMVAKGSWTKSEKQFEDAVNAQLGDGKDYRIQLSSYDATNGGKAIFKVQQSTKKDVDGNNDHWDDVDLLKDKKAEELVIKAFGKQPSDTKGMYKYNNFLVVENSPIVDKYLGKYNDANVKNLEHIINSATTVQDNINKQSGKPPKPNESIFKENGSPIHFTTKGQNNVRTINIVNNPNGGYIYQILQAPTLGATPYHEQEFTDKQSLVDYLITNGAK